jgi:hypothetical protein
MNARMSRWVVVSFLTVVAVAALAAQESPERFAFERPIRIDGAGPRRLSVDAPLLAAGSPFRVVTRGDRQIAEGGLTDLRLVDRSGRAVPYLLVHPRAPERPWITGRTLAIPATKRTSGFEVDLGRSATIDALRLSGIPAPFLKRVTLEGSGDRARWTTLADATLFDLPTERLTRKAIEFRPGDYRYVRVIWNDANSAPVPLPTGVEARLSSNVSGPPQAPIDVPVERESSEPGRSRYRIRLPGPRLPAIALEVQAAGGHVFRTATVIESRFTGGEAAPLTLGTATLSRVVRDGVEASDLVVRIEPPAEAEVQLQIDDGSNAPLEITRVLLHLADLPLIYLESPGGELLARYGNRAAAPPSYDLEALRRTLDVRQVPEAQWGEPRALTPVESVDGATAVPQPGGTLDASGFRHLRAIPGDGRGLIALQLDAAVLANSRGPSGRFHDVRVLDGENRQIPYLLERRDEPLQIDLRLEPATSSLEELKRAPGRQLSIYKVALPERQLPGVTLVLETSARVFQRSVRVGVSRGADRNRREPWFETLASAAWRHADEQSAAPALSMKVDPVDAAELLVVVDEGDNAALPIRSGRLLLPSYRIRFYQPQGSALRLAYGRADIQAPQYDLALLAQRVMGAHAAVVNAPGVTGPAASSANELIPLPLFWGLLGAAVLVILGLIVRLLKQ